MGNSNSSAFAAGYNTGYIDGQNFLAKAQGHLKRSCDAGAESNDVVMEEKLNALRLENHLLKQQVADMLADVNDNSKGGVLRSSDRVRKE
jgi:hypothetical protein